MADDGAAVANPPPKPVAASVARIRFLSYVRATKARWQEFCDAQVALRPLLQTDDVRKLVAVLDRHGRTRAEECFNMPVELVLEILSYVLPPTYNALRTHADDFKDPTTGGYHPLGGCTPLRAQCLQRALLANSAMYFLICENDHVKNPGVARRVAIALPFPQQSKKKTKKPAASSKSRPIPIVNGRPVIAAAPKRPWAQQAGEASSTDTDLTTETLSTSEGSMDSMGDCGYGDGEECAR